MTGFKFATLLRVVVLTLLFFAVAQPSTFAGEKSFTFVNMSGKTFWRLYVYRSDVSGGWGAYTDWLKQPLHHGEQVKISFPEEVQHIKYWDITIDSKDGTTWHWYGIELMTISTVTVDAEGTIHYR